MNMYPILNQEDHEGGGSTATIEKSKTKLPKKYKVLLHNDDYTTMEFVIFILQSVFHKNLEEAERVMLEVHVKGVGICGVYTHEIAESKSQKVLNLAKMHSHPLVSSIEPE